jgi:hypothetical protein
VCPRLLSCTGTGLAVGQFSVQGVIPECLKRFIASEMNSKSEQAREPNP